MADSELQAVEAALNTLVLAQTEAAFQKVVNRLLPALLSALATKSDAARAKCIQTLHHVNVRIRSHPQIKLPFDQVLQVAIDPKAAILTSNVAIQGGYLGRCFDRLSQSEQAGTLPHLVSAADTMSSQQNKDALHFLSIRALTAASVGQPKTSGDLLWQQVSSCADTAITSFFSYTFLALRGKLKSSIPEQSLLAVLRLASEYAGLNQPERAATVFPHFLVAAGNASRSNLAAAGESAMKRVDTCDVLASVDPSIAGILFDLFNDPHAEVSLRIVVLGKGLLRVTLCANCFPEVFDVFRHSLFAPGIPPRFQSLGMQFVSFVITNCDADVLEANTTEFVTLMMKLVNNDTDGGPPFSDKVRGFGYTALSDLAVHVPSLVHSSTIPAEIFFSAAQSKQHPPEVRTRASLALSTLARVVRVKRDDATSFRAKVLKTLMETVHDQDEVSVSARTAAVHWANECFLFSDPEARLVNIIAAADRSSRVSSLAAVGLSMTVTSAERVRQGISTAEDSYPEFESIVNKYSAYCRTHRPNPASAAVYLHFGMRCFNHMLAPGKKVELLPPGTIDRFLSTRTLTMKSVKTLLSTAHEALLGPAANYHPDLERAALTTVLFASKTTTLGAEVGSTYKNRIGDLLKLIERKSALGDVVLARALSMIIGACTPSFSRSDLLETIRLCGEGLEPNESGVADGRIGEDSRVAKIMAIGQVFRSLGSHEETLENAQSAQVSEITGHVAKRTMLAIDSSDIVRAAACNALADIGAERHLPISLADRQKVISNLTGVLKLISSSSRVVQAAAQALGKICIGEPRLSFKLKAMEGLLFVCRERKEEDIRFTASESLVRSVSSFDAPSPSILDEPVSDAKKSDGLVDPAALQSVLEMRSRGYSVREAVVDDGDEQGTSLVRGTIMKIINLATDERPNARAGGCVCLFTFLKLITDTPDSVTEAFATADDEVRFRQIQGELLDLLPDIQKAFTILLSDRSDFVQQLASCGIAFVYNICPPKDQKDLVASLVRSLTTGKKAAATVPGDRGVLLEFGGVDVNVKSTGARSATYKELCNLAQDMGEPELVYKFMDLAGHAALWNSRKGAALAGSALLNTDIAAEQLRPHVKSLLPRLYVYCYDPSESVRMAMGSVISAVVKASGHGSVSEAITANFQLVTDHCIKSMTSRQWRSREAGCGALRDILTSRTWGKSKT
ncbi:Proteasome-associated protein ECM29-like [Gracilariopsis chorda]|uniref:Proteasome-associated protein ECM29-like n=1 Tax=Gracilariopsis chorda TaxID=448386 RepID=A0A2V3IQ23_9FLOR|nr:Proteasome-associated protein ECM29-like [Gracilariopsis chorda]|eukprot:PXF44182.1 Proteasome-associated protein ECM29-like [Gracilariopsis chorda]